MLKEITKIALALAFILLFFGACRSKKQISSTSAVAVDTATAFVAPIDTFKSTEVSKQVYIPPQLTTLDYYNNAYNEIEEMLNGYRPLSFKRAVFLTENAYFQDKLDYEKFESDINLLVFICKKWMTYNKLNDYHQKDSIAILKNFAIYSLMKDTIKFQYGSPHYPYTYDFNDFFGQKDWSKMFVSKLLTTGNGNCHSLPYLYKIIANELNTEAFLTLAPNHIYLKHRCKGLGWYNTELTSGEFPTDAWIKASGYITLDAIRSGIFMDTLGQVQSVALTIYDLGQGYLYETSNVNDGFVLKCCDLVLKHHPTNVNAMILKAEILRKQYDSLLLLKQNRKAIEVKSEMEKMYMLALKSGYREMPKQMYLAWLKSVSEQKEKYSNGQIYKFKSK
ncbi:MAG: hypothetical protein MH472_09365 [Bacteroidia bacterium]|nr:hypothetical protein [Bacteroidia bacterium]